MPVLQDWRERSGEGGGEAPFLTAVEISPSSSCTLNGSTEDGNTMQHEGYTSPAGYGHSRSSTPASSLVRNSDRKSKGSLHPVAHEEIYSAVPVESPAKMPEGEQDLLSKLASPSITSTEASMACSYNASNTVKLETKFMSREGTNSCMWPLMLQEQPDHQRVHTQKLLQGSTQEATPTSSECNIDNVAEGNGKLERQSRRVNPSCWFLPFAYNNSSACKSLVVDQTLHMTAAAGKLALPVAEPLAPLHGAHDHHHQHKLENYTQNDHRTLVQDQSYLTRVKGRANSSYTAVNGVERIREDHFAGFYMRDERSLPLLFSGAAACSTRNSLICDQRGAHDAEQLQLAMNSCNYMVEQNFFQSLQLQARDQKNIEEKTHEEDQEAHESGLSLSLCTSSSTPLHN